MVQNLIVVHDNTRSHTAAAIDQLRRWQWEILEHPPYSPDMSPCDYDLFAKVKEPLPGTRYNTRDELLGATGWSKRNINKDGRADGVRRLPNIWRNMINQGATILKINLISCIYLYHVVPIVNVIVFIFTKIQTINFSKVTKLQLKMLVR